ncbi:uncharacterized protein C17orf114 isoform X1 [Platichthys flesus]|uniref:uncharacterized protein C17orf114 isoform X1 n=2 Tax=Platichthys flesus TaxID=8260 RepID=UPI002DB892F0|nr:uncharacterized protein C17orf114 isoform X1 [Platichthys flesus]
MGLNGLSQQWVLLIRPSRLLLWFRRCREDFNETAGGSIMGVKMLQCFPFYRRCKERCKSRQCPPATVPIEEMKPRLSSTTSCGSDSEGAGGLSRGSQIYFSTKARLSFRHQLDSNINAVDATY